MCKGGLKFNICKESGKIMSRQQKGKCFKIYENLPIIKKTYYKSVKQAFFNLSRKEEKKTKEKKS